MQDVGYGGQGSDVECLVPAPRILHPASFVCYSITAKISLSLISRYSSSPISMTSGA
jgi:hypothetical protein